MALIKEVVVSVIIPTYGEPTYLENAIKSVLNQTFQNWQLIIVDDNNPNSDARKRTESLVGSYLLKDNRIIYIKHEFNKNGAVARNTGFAVAKGEYIALLDSDDEYMQERLQVCLDVMKDAPADVAGVYTGCEFRRDGKVYYRHTAVSSGRFLKETLACTFMFSTGSNIFVRKSVVDELNGFDPTFLRHQDYEFLVRVFEKYSLTGIPDILVIKNNENINRPDIDKQIAIKEQYLSKYKYIIDELPAEEKNYIYLWKNVTLAEAAMAQKSYKMASVFYKEAKRYGSLPIKTVLKRIAFPFYNLFK